MNDVGVLASFMVDLISYVSRIPREGETIHANSYKQAYGGKGGNQLICSTRLGSKTVAIGKLGSDTFGDQYLKVLRNEGVQANHVVQCESHTGIALIVVSENGGNQIVVNAGANNLLSEEDIEKAQTTLNNCKVTFTKFM
jgi:ribokinase